jgi:hypothetical protein
MKTISRNGIATLLTDTAKGTRIVGVEYTTEPKVKKSCPFTNLKKHTANTVMLGVDYAKRLAQKGEVPAGADPYFEDVDGQNWLVKHKTNGTLYLRVSPTMNNVSKSFYTSEGNDVSSDDVKPHLYAKPEGAPDVFLIKLENIRRLKLNGEDYNVVG